MRGLVLVCFVVAPGLAGAEPWTARGCGEEPSAPHYTLATRDAYNEAVRAVNAYQQAARAYSACVLKQAHADQTTISRQAQDRIAEIQTAAVGEQQAIYARFAAQTAAFKTAAARLKAK